jgi:hypothetical protein
VITPRLPMRPRAGQPESDCSSEPRLESEVIGADAAQCYHTATAPTLLPTARARLPGAPASAVGPATFAAIVLASASKRLQARRSDPAARSLADAERRLASVVQMRLTQEGWWN